MLDQAPRRCAGLLRAGRREEFEQGLGQKEIRRRSGRSVGPTQDEAVLALQSAPRKSSIICGCGDEFLRGKALPARREHPRRVGPTRQVDAPIKVCLKRRVPRYICRRLSDVAKIRAWSDAQTVGESSGKSPSSRARESRRRGLRWTSSPEPRGSVAATHFYGALRGPPFKHPARNLRAEVVHRGTKGSSTPTRGPAVGHHVCCQCARAP